MSIRVLLVEDEKKEAAYLERGLREEGFAVTLAKDFETGWDYLKSQDWTVIIIDWSHSGNDGLSLLQRIRHIDSNTPIMIISLRNSVEDRVKCLNHGADDYLCMPFAFAEFVARTLSLSRRSNKNKMNTLTYHDIRLDLATQRVERAGHLLDLKAKEYALLLFFLGHPEEVLTRTQIYDQVWKEKFDGASKTLEVHVMELRRKLEAHGPRVIYTFRNRGYVLCADITRIKNS